MINQSILIVENNHLHAKEIEQHLLEMNYLVAGHATNGKDAIKMSKETQPNSVIMDIELDDDMSGIEAALSIQQNLGIPIIYLTQYDSITRYREAKMNVRAEFICKPFKRLHLLNALDNVFSRYWEYTPGRESAVFAKIVGTEEPIHIRIKMNDIIIIRGRGVNSMIYTLEENYLVSVPLQHIERRLIIADQFARSNRFEIINLEKVKQIMGKSNFKKMELTEPENEAIGNRKIKVSPLYQPQIMAKMIRI